MSADYSEPSQYGGVDGDLVKTISLPDLKTVVQPDDSKEQAPGNFDSWGRGRDKVKTSVQRIFN